MKKQDGANEDGEETEEYGFCHLQMMVKIVPARILQSAKDFLRDLSTGEGWEEHMETVALGPPLFLSTKHQYCSPGGAGHCMETLVVVITGLFTGDIGDIVPQGGPDSGHSS